MAERHGLNVLLNDPPKGIGVSLDVIAKNSDIITFHVPLDNSTYHMCDAAFLAKCKPHSLIINAARGGVVDEQALLHSGHPYILDTWENEPDINPDVLQHARLASMHIAGYSVQGKRNASQMCLDEIAKCFGLKRIDISNYHYLEISAKNEDSAPCWLSRVSESLKSSPIAFEALRKSYPLREG
jgi:erythronate-4-phosphate dehydrogenase